MKTMNILAAMMLMTITAAMPATAKNKKESHFDRVEMKHSHFDRHHRDAYRPEIKSCTLVLGRHDSHRKLAKKADRMKGVIDTKWNPRTRELTIIYGAKMTSARHIRHFMA